MSKELEALERIVGCSTIESHRPKWQEDYKVVETALKEHELMKEIRITARFDLAQVNKEHKALEIIKEKVNLRVRKTGDVEIYILIIENIFYVPISQEQYDILKGVLL